MEEMNEIYTYIGNVLNNNMNDNNWETIKFNMQADVDYCGYDGTYTDTMGLVHDLDIDIPIEMDDKIWRLLELTKKNNFVPWNKAVYTLEKNGHFDMTFECNQALQDEWDNAQGACAGRRLVRLFCGMMGETHGGNTNLRKSFLHYRFLSMRLGLSHFCSVAWTAYTMVLRADSLSNLIPLFSKSWDISATLRMRFLCTPLYSADLSCLLLPLWAWSFRSLPVVSGWRKPAFLFRFLICLFVE